MQRNTLAGSLSRGLTTLTICLVACASVTPTRAAEPPAGPIERGDGVQVWTCQPPWELSAFDLPPAGEVSPIRLVGVRNGRFAGQIVLASGKPITGVKVTVSDLATADGKAHIPADRVEVRFAMPGEPMRQNMFVPEHRFDALLPDAPKEVPVRTVAIGSRYRSPKRLAGAMLPVWVTVHVPRDAAPGTYNGTATVTADRLPAVTAPLSITVHGWTMPDPKDYTCRNNIYQSHESSALRYEAPLWSDRHFDLMGQVLDLTRPMGNGLCIVHLICGAYHQGNSQSLVRWIRKGETGYEYDFAILDRYLGVYEKALGRPKVVLLSVFTPYSVRKDRKTGEVSSGATVSLLDPATAKVEPLTAPLFGTPEAVAFWKPVLTAVFARLEKRGWMDAVVIGTASDNGPRTTDIYDTLLAIWPDLRVMFSGHPNRSSVSAKGKKRIPVTVREHVWSAGRLRKTYPWPRIAAPGRGVFAFSRAGAGMCHLQQNESLAAYRANAEMCLQTGNSGIGRVGADFWLPPGRRTPLSGSVGAHIGPSASVTSFTAAGPAGPVSTTRLEMYVEGMQAREAIGFLLQAMAESKLDAALAARCTDYLAKRAATHLKHQPKKYNYEKGLPYQEDWQTQEDALFALCAEAAGGK